MNNSIFYKFRKINKHLLASLLNSHIHFAYASYLNDPFDCRVDVQGAIENAIIMTKSETREILRNWKEQLQDFFEENQTNAAEYCVCAFSCERSNALGAPEAEETNTLISNTLMWSHYADDHRGVCLVYDFPTAYFKENDEKKDPILGPFKVKYGTNPLTDWLIDSARNPAPFREFAGKLSRELLTIKAEAWEYEQEVRMLRRTPGEATLDREYLRHVCFGLQTAEADVALVKKIIELGQYYNLTFYKIVRCSETNFGLKAIKI